MSIITDPALHNPRPADSHSLRITTVSSLADIRAEDWNRFAGTDNPLLCHEFLLAFETSGCTTAGTGWQPRHLLFHLGDEWVGVAPAYIKTHSMGEYVFDWSWAEAWHRHQTPYYPKLLIAIPFTPCQGPRLLLSETARPVLQPEQIHQALDALMSTHALHSWHLLFPDTRDQQLLQHPQALHRLGCQFHWFNRNYRDFDEFLATLTSRKRKNLRKERQRVRDQDIHFHWHTGPRISEEVLQAFHLFYQATYLKRGQQPYLNSDFFRTIIDQLGERVRILTASTGDRVIAAALFLVGEKTLYGRYWGCLEEYDQLHFETCYYRGIDLAIELGLERFDAGAQGEHKLVRGFEPLLTHSWHNVAHPGFRPAVADFCAAEAEQVLAYKEAACAALPYRKG